MKVSGFTFIRNAVKYDYPIVESIKSILPLVDEYVVLLGQSDDNTIQLIKTIDSDKIKIIPSIWDDSLRLGGKVLAVETNKAFQKVSANSDWAFYLQGDEVIHEKYHKNIQNAMNEYLADYETDGLLLNYKHFYGSYNYVGNSRRWYRKEIRIIRNDKNISSYRDAQGFRKNNKKLKVRQIDAWVYHYGWVKPPEIQKVKTDFFPSLYHKDNQSNNDDFSENSFDYSNIDSLAFFNETHPKVMENRIAAKNWNFNFDPTKKNFDIKTRLLNALERITNYRFAEYKNYTLLKKF